MVPEVYRELFAAVAATAGSLTGLLFVALSVTGRARAAGPSSIQQVRAAAALLAFTNAMAVSLFSLVPGTNPGYPAVVLGVIGLLFTAAGVRTILSSQATAPQQRQQLGLVILLLRIARAWELVGERDTGLWASLSVLTGRTRGLDDGPD